MKEELLLIAFWYLVSWYVVKNEYLQYIFDQLDVKEGEPVSFARLAWGNWFKPFVSCPWCSAFLFTLIGQLVGVYSFTLLIALVVSFFVRLFVTIFGKWMMK